MKATPTTNRWFPWLNGFMTAVSGLFAAALYTQNENSHWQVWVGATVWIVFAEIWQQRQDKQLRKLQQAVKEAEDIISDRCG